MKKSLLLTAATALLLTACQDTVNTIENAEKKAAVRTISDTRFVTDRFLKNRLKLQSIRTAVNSGGLLTVEVAALNDRTGFFPEWWSHITGENPYPVEYKFEWQDENGMNYASHLSGIWQRITIRPGETVYFRAVAPAPGCRDFVLSVKEQGNK